jgi:hypothetical protein
MLFLFFEYSALHKSMNVFGKTITSVIFAINATMTCELSAQNPDPSGAWRFSAFDVGFTTGSDGTIFGSSNMESDTVTINPDGTLMAPEGAGGWFFSDDFIYFALGDVQRAAITRDLDTLVLVDAEVNATGDGNFSNNVGLNAAVRLPTTDFTRAEVAGTWQLHRQTSISFSDSLFGATGYNGVFHARETLVLNPNGSFTLTFVSNTDPGDSDAGSSVNGSWSVIGRTIRLSAGGETLDIVNLSAGLDTFINFESESFTQGSNTNFNRVVTFGVREATALHSAELVGRWGLTGMTIDVEDDLTETYLQDFRGAVIESSHVTLFADGNGIYHRTSSNDPELPATENFIWQIVGAKLVVTTSDAQVLDFDLSEGKDFAVGLHIENGPGGDNDAYDLFTLCRLPDAPGFQKVVPGFDFSGLPRLCIATTNGLFYQLQRSTDLNEWLDVGVPVEGDGTEKCLEDPTVPQPAVAFYRWGIVASPKN